MRTPASCTTSASSSSTLPVMRSAPPAAQDREHRPVPDVLELEGQRRVERRRRQHETHDPGGDEPPPRPGDLGDPGECEPRHRGAHDRRRDQLGACRERGHEHRHRGAEEHRPESRREGPRRGRERDQAAAPQVPASTPMPVPATGSRARKPYTDEMSCVGTGERQHAEGDGPSLVRRQPPELQRAEPDRGDEQAEEAQRQRRADRAHDDPGDPGAAGVRNAFHDGLPSTTGGPRASTRCRDDRAARGRRRRRQAHLLPGRVASATATRRRRAVVGGLRSADAHPRRRRPAGRSVSTATVVGGGPAGLMAAEVLARAGVAVTVYDRMPSVGRKLLLAGRGGLNLTHTEDRAPVPRPVRRLGRTGSRPMLERVRPGRPAGVVRRAG